MLDIYRYGQAAMEERRQDRRLAEVENYLRREYGSSSGMGRYIAEANHTSSPPSGLRAFLAKIAGVVSKSTRVATPAVSVKPASSERGTDKPTRPARRVIVEAPRSARFRQGRNVRPRTALPPLKR